MKALKRISNYIIAAGLLLCGYGEVRAQVQDYTFSQAILTYSPITGGTVLKSGTGSYRQIFNNVPVGFTFNYNGVRVTDISVHGNGYIGIGQPASGTGTYLFADASAAGNNQISPFSGTADKTGTLGTAELRYETQGVAPNRKFIIQWKDLAIASASPTETNTNFQCILYETSNKIDFVYGNCTKTSANNPYDYIFIGIKGGNSLDINARETNRTPQIIDNTFPSTSIYPYCYYAIPPTFTTPTLPSQGLTMTWTPPPSGDFKVLTLIGPFSPCGNAVDSVKIRFKNTGLDSIAPGTLNVSVRLKGAVNTTLSATYPGAVYGKQELNFAVGAINTYNLADTIRYEMVVTYAGDANHANDTLIKVVNYFTPTATITVADKSRCGFGTVTMSATGLGSSESVLWYTSFFFDQSYLLRFKLYYPYPYSFIYTIYILCRACTADSAMTLSTPNGTNWGFGGTSMGMFMDITADVANMMIEKLYHKQMESEQGNRCSDLRKNRYI